MRFKPTNYKHLKGAAMYTSYEHIMIKASVSMERPGVHVQLRVAAAAAMIKLQPNSKNARNRHRKETV
jgi:hypothetical protein